MPARAELKGKLNLTTSGATRALRGVLKDVKGFGKEVSSALGTGAKIGFAAVAAGAVAASVAFAVGTKKAFDLGSAFSDMHAKTGIAIDQLQILTQAAKDNGIEDVTGAVKKMQVNLVEATKAGTGPAAEALNLLGLRAEELIGKLPTEQLQIIGERINAIQNPAVKASAAVALFGKSGTDMLAMFEDSSALATAAQSLGKQSKLLRDNAAIFDRISDRLNRAGLKLQGFFIGAATKIAPLVDYITKKFDAIDLSDFGKDFGDSLTKGVDYLVDVFHQPGAIAGELTKFLKVGFLEAGNYLIMAFKTLGPISNSMLTGLTMGFVGLGKIITGTLSMAFGTAIANLMADIASARESWSGKLSGEERSGIEKELKGLEKRKKQIQDVMAGRASEPTNSILPFNEKGLAVTNREIARMQDQLKKGSATPIEELRTKALKGVVGGAEGSIASGKADIANATTDLFKTIEKSIRDVKYVDETGAAKAKAELVAGFRRHAAAGAKTLAALTGGGETRKSMGAFGGSRLIFSPTMLTTGGLTGHGGLAASPYGQTPLLSVRERRAMENARVAAGGDRDLIRGRGVGAHDIIRRGDKARAREVEKERLRREGSIERTNELLGGIYGYSERTASALEED